MDEKSAKDHKRVDPAIKDAALKCASGKVDDRPTPRTGRLRAAVEGLPPIGELIERREVRIAMAALSILVLVLGYIFVSKINDQSAASTQTGNTAFDDAVADQRKPATAPLPTVVTADSSQFTSAQSPTSPPGQRGVHASEIPADHHVPPNTSYLPNRTTRTAANDIATHRESANDSAMNSSEQGITGDSPRRVAVGEPSGAASGADRYSQFLTSQPNVQRSPGEDHDRDAPGDSPEADVAASRTGDADEAIGRYARGHVANNVDDRTPDNTPDNAGVVSKPTHLAPTIVEADGPADAEKPGNGIADNAATERPAVGDAASDERPPRPPVAPENRANALPANQTYVTVEGDTPASVAQRVYADARLAAALLAYNGADLAVDEPLAPGGEMLIPQRTVLERAFPKLVAIAAAKNVASDGAERPTLPAPRRSADAIATNEGTTNEGTTTAIEQPVAATVAPAGDADRVPSDARHNAVATRLYEVARGESIYEIARKELGRVSRWRDILELNRDQLGDDIDAIEPGMKLRLPDEGRTEVARQRGELLWR